MWYRAAEPPPPYPPPPDVWQMNGLSVEMSAGLRGLLEDVLRLISTAGSLGLPSEAGAYPRFIMKRFRRGKKSNKRGQVKEKFEGMQCCFPRDRQ